MMRRGTTGAPQREIVYKCQELVIKTAGTAQNYVFLLSYGDSEGSMGSCLQSVFNAEVRSISAYAAATAGASTARIVATTSTIAPWLSNVKRPTLPWPVSGSFCCC